MNTTERGKINREIEMDSTDEGYENLGESFKAYHKDQQNMTQKLEDEEQPVSTSSFANSQQVKQDWSSRIMCLLVCFILGVFFTSAASLTLAIVLLSGNVGISHNDCSRSRLGPSAERLKDFQDLKENVSSLRIATIKAELEDMKLKYERLQGQIKLAEGRISALGRNKSAPSTAGDQSNDLTTLWLVNSTIEILGGISSLWAAVNTSGKGLNDVRMQVLELEDKVKNNDNKTGPRGPPGYNGTQGPAGTPGSQGSPGPPGRGSNITLCAYKKASSTGIPVSRYAIQEISRTESTGTKFLGVNCDTNDARVTRLSSTAAADGRRTYKCKCSDTLGTGDAKMYCYIHYWECQTNT